MLNLLQSIFACETFWLYGRVTAQGRSDPSNVKLFDAAQLKFERIVECRFVQTTSIEHREVAVTTIVVAEQENRYNNTHHANI